MSSEKVRSVVVSRIILLLDAQYNSSIKKGTANGGPALLEFQIISFVCYNLHHFVFYVRTKSANENCSLQILHSHSTTINTSCWILRPKRSRLAVLCIFGIFFFRYCATGSISFFRRSTPTDIQCNVLVDRQLDGGSLTDSPEAEEDASRHNS